MVIGVMVVLALILILMRDLFGASSERAAGMAKRRPATADDDTGWATIDEATIDGPADLSPRGYTSSFDDDHALAVSETLWVNPATGLTMVDGIGGVDAGGNLFGCDLHADMNLDAGCMFDSHGCGSCFDDFRSTTSSFDSFD